MCTVLSSVHQVYRDLRMQTYSEGITQATARPGHDCRQLAAEARSDERREMGLGVSGKTLQREEARTEPFDLHQLTNPGRSRPLRLSV